MAAFFENLPSDGDFGFCKNAHLMVGATFVVLRYKCKLGQKKCGFERSGFLENYARNVFVFRVFVFVGGSVFPNMRF